MWSTVYTTQSTKFMGHGWCHIYFVGSERSSLSFLDVDLHTNTYTHIHTKAFTDIHVHVHTYIHTHTYTHIHIHIHNMAFNRHLYLLDIGNFHFLG